MSSVPGKMLLGAGHSGVAVGIEADVKAGEDFIPDTGGCIAAVLVVEMVAVAAESIAEFGLSGVLDGLAAGDKGKG